nr:MAG TPA: hypothetical protein [Siphoviridae sp. ctBWu8]
MKSRFNLLYFFVHKNVRKSIHDMFKYCSNIVNYGVYWIACSYLSNHWNLDN